MEERGIALQQRRDERLAIFSSRRHDQPRPERCTNERSSTHGSSSSQRRNAGRSLRSRALVSWRSRMSPRASSRPPARGGPAAVTRNRRMPPAPPAIDPTTEVRIERDRALEKSSARHPCA